jgi:hypothetical protein
MDFQIFAVDESARVGDARDVRRTTRAPCGAIARIRSERDHSFGFCSDLSLGGMLFIGPELPLSRRVAISLHLPAAGLVLVEGEVIAHRKHRGADASILRFPSLSAKNLRLISRFLALRLFGKACSKPASA